MGEIIEADKSFFKKQAQQKKIPSSLKISSLLDELEEEMKPDNKSYEKKIHQQIIDLIKNNFNLKGDVMFRAISIRNNSKESVDYYDFWAPIE